MNIKLNSRLLESSRSSTSATSPRSITPLSSNPARQRFCRITRAALPFFSTNFRSEFSPPGEQPFKHVSNVTPEYHSLILEPRAPEVLPDHACRLAIFFNERRPNATAAKSLYAQSAGSGVEVECLATVEELAQRVEDRLPHPVGGRSDALRDRREPDSASRASDDPHWCIPRRRCR